MPGSWKHASAALVMAAGALAPATDAVIPVAVVEGSACATDPTACGLLPPVALSLDPGAAAALPDTYPPPPAVPIDPALLGTLPPAVVAEPPPAVPDPVVPADPGAGDPSAGPADPITEPPTDPTPAPGDGETGGDGDGTTDGTTEEDREPASAAEVLGWGAATRTDAFDAGPALAPQAWTVADGAGPDGTTRSPAAVTVGGGSLTVTAGGGRTGSACWLPAATTGRWEALVRVPVAGSGHRPVLLLAPETDGAVGVAFLDVTDAQRTSAGVTVRQGTTVTPVATTPVDAAAWHHWAIEWGPQDATAYLDGRPWWTGVGADLTTPRRLCVQIERLPLAPATATASIEVAEVRFHPLPAS